LAAGFQKKIGMVVEGGFCCFAGVFEGWFRKMVFLVVVNRGEIVVSCVVSEDSGMPVFGGQKMVHPFKIYFCWGLTSLGIPLKRFAGTAEQATATAKYGDPSLRSG
jgi:hypothetical protein